MNTQDLQDVVKEMREEFAKRDRQAMVASEPHTISGETNIYREYQLLQGALEQRDAEIERMKALWYADADPTETEYAEDYRAQAALNTEGK